MGGGGGGLSIFYYILHINLSYFKGTFISLLKSQLNGNLGPISQRDLSPDLDLNLRLWS